MSAVAPGRAAAALVVLTFALSLCCISLSSSSSSVVHMGRRIDARPSESVRGFPGRLHGAVRRARLPLHSHASALAPPARPVAGESEHARARVGRGVGVGEEAHRIAMAQMEQSAHASAGLWSRAARSHLSFFSTARVPLVSALRPPPTSFCPRCSQGAPISQVLQRIEWVYRASWSAFRDLQKGLPSYTAVIAFHAVVRPSTTLCLWCATWATTAAAMLTHAHVSSIVVCRVYLLVVCRSSSRRVCRCWRTTPRARRSVPTSTRWSVAPALLPPPLAEGAGRGGAEGTGDRPAIVGTLAHAPFLCLSLCCCCLCVFALLCF